MKVLVSLDHIWWQLRNKLDAYLEVAEDEIQARIRKSWSPHRSAGVQDLGLERLEVRADEDTEHFKPV